MVTATTPRAHDRSGANPEPGSGRGVRRAGFAVLAVATAGIAFLRVFPAESLPVPIVAGTALGAAGVLLATRARRLRVVAGVVLTVIAALVAGVLSATLAARPGASAGAALPDVADAVVGGWRRALTITLPTPPAPDLLPLVAVVLAVAAALAVGLARRAEARLSAFVPGVAVFCLALALGVHGSGSALAVTAPLLAVLVIAVLSEGLGQHAGTGGVGRSRGAVVAVPLAAVLAAVAVLAVPAIAGNAGRSPANPRHVVSPPVTTPDLADPLSVYPARLSHPQTTAFTATVDPAWRHHRPLWRLATFTRYDGSRWRASGHALSVGYDVPSPAATATPSTVTVTPVSLGGIWVPISGPVRHVDQLGLGYQLAGQVLVDPSGIAGHRYRVTASLPHLSAAGLRRASVPSSGSAAALTRLPACVPQTLTQAAAVAVRGRDTPIEQAVAVEQYLARKGGFKVDPHAKSGLSCARIATFVGNDRVGTPLQFAATCVLMLRSVGLPARLVAGFRPGRLQPGEHTVVVDDGDAYAWPEVQLAGAGWVALAPTPNAGATQQRREKALQEVRRHIAKTRPTPAPAPAAPKPKRHVQATGGLGAAALAGVAIGALLLALLVLTPITIVAAKGVRRRMRRTRGDPGARVLGAWRELLDRLAEHGVEVRSLTPAEAVSTVSQLAPAATRPAGALGIRVDGVVYAGENVADESATEAWCSQRQAAGALRHAAGRWRRLRWTLSPRPLRRGR
jgi:hypothetical protein